MVIYEIYKLFCFETFYVYGIDLCNMVISVKGDIIKVNPYIIQLFQSSMYLVERSDTSHGIYLGVAFMTVLALHPEAVIRRWLL